jgi:hypothetical protein
MNNTRIFKLGVSLFVLFEFCFLGGLLFAVVSEYDPFFEETVGLAMISISVVAGIAVLLFELHQLLRWKPARALKLKF